MSAEGFHSQARNGSTVMRHGNGMEGNGMEEEWRGTLRSPWSVVVVKKSFIVTFRNARGGRR